MSEYFPEVAWRTIVDNVTVTATPYYYTVDVFPLDSNEPGADPLDIAVGYWLIDNGGYTYLITDVSGSTITVYDINERSWGDSYIGPLEDLPGYVYKTKNGAFLLSQSQLRFLDKSASDILYPIEKGIIWKYRGIEINALYGDSEAVETIAEDSIDNITKLSLSPEFILRTEEDGWQGGKKYSLSLDGLLHNTLPDIQGTGLGDDYIHLDQDQIDALWTKDGLNITRDSAASLTGILSVNEIKSYTSALPLIKKDGNNVRISTCILSDCVNGRVGIFTETPLDHLHLTGYARISTLAETANSSIVTSNADGRLIKLPYDNNESKYLRSDGTWAVVLTSTGDFLDSVIRMVVDSTFDPGTPSNGDRYIILNAASIHANFGTINKISDGSALTLGNNDIVQYYSTYSEFRIVYDASAAMQPATVTVGTDKNGNTNHQWTYNVTDDIWVDRGAAINHNSLDGLNDGDYKHLTAAQYTNFISLTDGSDISNTLHNHNTVYYTKTSIDAFFAGTTAKAGYNKSNWDSAYAHRLKWDGGSTGLNAATGRASLGLTDAVLGTGSAGRVAFWNSANGLTKHDDFLFDNGTLSFANGLGGRGVHISNEGIKFKVSETAGWGISIFAIDQSYTRIGNIVGGFGVANSFSYAYLGGTSYNSAALYAHSNNSVSINKTSVAAGYTLDVNGNARVVGSIYATASIIAAGNIRAMGNITIDGDARLKTSLSGLLQASSGVVSTAVSGTDIKTINGSSILGSGNIDINTEDLRWDGGSNGLVAATGRASLGLGTAATRNVGAGIGNVMEVGAFGLGGEPIILTGSEWDVTSMPNQFVRATDASDSIFNGAGVGINLRYSTNYAAQLLIGVTSTLSIKARATSSSGVWGDVQELYHTGNLVNPVTGTGTAGRVSYWNGTGSQAGSSNLTFDSGNNNVIIGRGNSNSNLTIYGTTAAPTTSGSVLNGLFRLGSTATELVLDMGIQNVGLFYTWLQSRNRTNNTTNYALALNPNGGNVLIGKTSVTSGYLLDVDGAIQSTGLKVGTLSGLLKASSGVVGKATAGTDYQAPLTNPITGTGTASQIACFTGTTSLVSLSTDTYPSLTELSRVKGVTSAIQTQLNNKQATLVSGTNIKTINNQSLIGSGNIAINTEDLRWDGGSTGLNAATGRASLGLTNAVTGTGTAGQISYWNGSGSQAGSANLVWDNNLKVRADAAIRFERSGNGLTGIEWWGTDPNLKAFKAAIRNINIGSFRRTGIGFYTSDIADWTTEAELRMLILRNGNVLIGTTTDSGYKLDVNGATQTTGLKIGTLSGLLNASSGTVGTADIVVQSTEPTTTGRVNGDIWVES